MTRKKRTIVWKDDKKKAGMTRKKRTIVWKDDKKKAGMTCGGGAKERPRMTRKNVMISDEGKRFSFV